MKISNFWAHQKLGMASCPCCAGEDLRALPDSTVTKPALVCMWCCRSPAWAVCPMFPTPYSIQLERRKNQPGRCVCEMPPWEARGNHGYTEGKARFESWAEGRRSESQKSRPWETAGRERKTPVLPSVPSLAGRCFLLPQTPLQEMSPKRCCFFTRAQRLVRRNVGAVW